MLYGLQIVLPPQFVVPAPPSALTAVGTTKVLRKRTAAPSTSRIRFTLFSPWDCELDRDSFMAADLPATGFGNL